MSRFPLRPELTPEQALEEIQETVGWYREREGCVRKYICLNWEERYGIGVYLWESREQAEAFYAAAAAEIERQTGGRPQITYFDTPLILDNAARETIIEGHSVSFDQDAAPA